MWVYLLLAAGLFMGWSLGTNDAANAFGTAVSTGVVKYRTAIIIIAVLVLIGAVTLGPGNISEMDKLGMSNEVSFSSDDVVGMDQQTIVLKAALKGAIVFVAAALTVFLMSALKMPVSANQAVIGAVIGWGLCFANYGDPAIRTPNLLQLGKFASTWLISPLGAGIISFVLIWFANKFIIPKVSGLSAYDKIVKLGYLVAGGFASFSIGMNSSASVMAFYYDGTSDGVVTNLFSVDTFTGNFLTAARVAATIGGIAIAIGVLTYSKKVMMTVGSSIAPLTQIEGFIVIIAMSLTIVLIGNIMHIPVSTSQAVVGAVVGAGLTKGVKNVNFGVFKNIGIAWVSSPVCAGIITFLIGLCTKGYFA